MEGLFERYSKDLRDLNWWGVHSSIVPRYLFVAWQAHVAGRYSEETWCKYMRTPKSIRVFSRIKSRTTQ
ncbi:hypothetical protein I7I50_08181 [Histoplasma capsulatum G186AR]|uniref:Uncharacterized protein n=1 Tax=Ajellomyces capsulatus TaxID=5037 RepID=A0A8H7YK11_AJECA|nr:hypothetical protein I7I52_08696 [Histoplasma capsulatum]QSS68686.1 hypothetical protein I7I50_08181 [Histoplasma capsulatum G186AR]